MKMMNRKEPNRKKDGAFVAVTCLLFLAVLALIFAGITIMVSDRDFITAYKAMFITMMFFFGIPILIASGLIAFTKIDEDDTWKYGLSWYYVSMIVTRILFSGLPEDQVYFSFSISGLIVFLVLVIIHIKTK